MNGTGSMLTLVCASFGVLAVAYFGAVFGIEIYYARQQEVVRAAQKLELAPGVTLLRGILAFFGRGGRWKESKGLVYVECGFADKDKEDGLANGIELVLCVDPKAGRIEVVSCRLEGGYSAENLLDALVRAASEQ